MENTSSTPKRPDGYYQQYYQKNREKRLAAVHASRQRHLEAVRARDAAAKRVAKPRTKANLHQRYWRIRREILEILGGKCVVCGFDDMRALQVDHVNGGGTQDRKTRKTMPQFRKDVREYGTAKYQVLCANCHQIKQYEANKAKRT